MIFISSASEFIATFDYVVMSTGSCKTGNETANSKLIYDASTSTNDACR